MDNKKIITISLTPILSFLFVFYSNRGIFNELLLPKVVGIVILVSLTLLFVETRFTSKKIYISILSSYLVAMLKEMLVKELTPEIVINLFNVAAVIVFTVAIYFLIGYFLNKKDINIFTKWMLILLSPVMLFAGYLAAYIIIGFILYQITSLFI